MSFNSKAYLDYEQRRLEPDDVIITGTCRRYSSIRADKNKWLESLTEEQRQQLKDEADEEFIRRQNGFN